MILLLFTVLTITIIFPKWPLLVVAGFNISWAYAKILSSPIAKDRVYIDSVCQRMSTLVQFLGERLVPIVKLSTFFYRLSLYTRVVYLKLKFNILTFLYKRDMKKKGIIL